MTLVGNKAPSFVARAIVDGQHLIENFSLEQFLGKQEVILVFYPKDFTYVCPTELIAFQAHLAEFKSRNIALVACSTDTVETHRAWLATPCNRGGIEGVSYPLVADESKTIAANFGVLAGNWSVSEDDQHITFQGSPIAYRGTFLIDKQGVVRYQAINDFPLGRSVQEILRIIDMWQHNSKYGEVCPADWHKGMPALQATLRSVSEYLTNKNR